MSKSHIAYQSLAFAATLLSLLTWTGPNVSPFALAPTAREVSLIVISDDVATIVPVAESLLILTLNFSSPSVCKSSASVIVKLPLLLLIVNVSLILLEKSEDDIIPLTPSMVRW